jgi:SpoVK/Ycf46/Vps4 family AAA+-type ATPase
VIGATNNASSMDPAVLRPGRFDRKILVDQPDEEGRKEIFEVHTEGRDLADDVTTEWLIENTDDTYSGADIEAVCEEAAMSAMRRCVQKDIEETEIGREDFERAFQRRNHGGDDDEVSNAFV